LSCASDTHDIVTRDIVREEKNFSERCGYQANREELVSITLSALSEAGYERSIHEHMTTMPFEAIRPVADDLAHRAWINELELDNFHVVLVPFRFSERERPLAGPRTDTDRPFVLSLTWKELIKRLDTSASSRCSKANVVRFGEVTVDLDSMEVRRSKHLVPLTAMEFKVLRFFAANPNRVLSRDDLLNQVWGYNNYPSTRTVDNHILRLRQKLEPDFGSPVHFRTVHGIGYKFTP